MERQRFFALLGVSVSLGAGVTLRSVVYGMSPYSPACLAGALGVVAMAAGMACWLPIHRATRVNPMEALRSE